MDHGHGRAHRALLASRFRTWWNGADRTSRGGSGDPRLRAIPAQKSDPFLRADSPWEEHLRHATVIRDGGIYRLWYDTKSLGCYAESDDGTTWRKPKLGRREFDGNTANNILWGENLPPEPDYIGAGCVFIDPSAPAQERYKSFHNRHIDADVFERVPPPLPGGYESPGTVGNRAR